MTPDVRRAIRSLREDLPNHFTMHVGEPGIASLERVGQTFVVDPEEVDNVEVAESVIAVK